MGKQPLPEPQWYAVMTAPRKELLALRNLKRAGYWTFHAFDRVRRWRKRAGKAERVLEWVERPHFAGYVFVALRFVGESLDAIQPPNEMRASGMDGIRSVVRSRFTGEAMRIPNWAMDLICDHAAVRFGDVDKIWFAALMEQIVLDDAGITRLYIDKSSGKRAIVTDLPESSGTSSEARSIA